MQFSQGEASAVMLQNHADSHGAVSGGFTRAKRERVLEKAAVCGGVEGCERICGWLGIVYSLRRWVLLLGRWRESLLWW